MLFFKFILLKILKNVYTTINRSKNKRKIYIQENRYNSLKYCKFSVILKKKTDSLNIIALSLLLFEAKKEIALNLLKFGVKNHKNHIILNLVDRAQSYVFITEVQNNEIFCKTYKIFWSYKIFND